MSTSAVRRTVASAVVLYGSRAVTRDWFVFFYRRWAMRKGFLTAMVALGMAATTATALAGLKINSTVTVNTTSRYATGALGSARNSADSVQYIGCSVTDSAGSAFVSCSARNSAGRFASCTSSDVGKVSAASSINSDSYIYFRYDSSGVCTYLSVSTFSYYPTKAH